MNLEQAMAFIESTGKFGSKLGLDNITVLMSYLNNPEDDLKFIHVAGTNGKGSACAMISNVLIRAGYNTGLFISPYLEKYNERIQMNNCPISDDDLISATEAVKNAVDKMMADGYEHPTEFEINTAMAFMFYKAKKADIVVLEVGMGGELDATNVIKTSETSVIMSIGYDHQLYLGDTLEKIAFAKAGIIKEDSDVCVYPLNTNGVKDVIKKQAALKNAAVHILSPECISVISAGIDGQRLKYNNPESLLDVSEFDLGLLGNHQAYNALSALCVLEVLKGKGWNITKKAVEEGMQSVKFNGRFEVLCKSPYVVIDGGHNIDGVTTFVNAVKTYFEGKKVTLFFGMLSDKQVEQSVELLTSIAKRIYTLTPDDPRAVSAEEMRDYIKKRYTDMDVTALSGASDINKYLDLTNKDEIFAFTGSLYMIGKARTAINNMLAEIN